MKNQFAFYEVVLISMNHEADLKELIGKRGTVLGMSQHEETHRWCYAVSIDLTGEVWHVAEEHITSTGEVKQRSDFYSDDSIKVEVDPETFEGSLGS